MRRRAPARRHGRRGPRAPARPDRRGFPSRTSLLSRFARTSRRRVLGSRVWHEEPCWGQGKPRSSSCRPSRPSSSIASRSGRAWRGRSAWHSPSPIRRQRRRPSSQRARLGELVVTPWSHRNVRRGARLLHGCLRRLDQL